ncbi:aldose 1-epimerase family protein [Aliarcobacter butzleri]|uniref:aldose 1-epimerase family protein n=1 Tax=Aliarcobacter butzleri TaxID=28197 RepID=UPI001260EECB|nr:aldose 1-epimerase family protein [Aliarcobacter butzleri]MCT7551074.1 aldose 1-epimerase family protein [Aliarcobacter butzleri]MCT7560088.1 aldose 1-epimerase family protein [Aliarcobacter butzleri]MCT7626904.1 aldose 1-epimerase family protein [Aliarcobacter butzleri]MCT7636583.1 aldose 1-epimerase family protein [Aliarcobacter butzleri]MCT7644518.1 aldose 1-epimerase family protein [Aliarcobacter butzleri]
MNYQIKNSFIKAQIKSFGAELNSLKKCDENFEYIWQADDKYWARHSPVLFPIVGRLKEDNYFYKNKKYSLSQHGIARDKEFEIVQNEADFIEFRLKSDEKSLEFYPFFFELDIGYKLDKNSLIVSYKVKNKSDEKMYFSIGAHPAFNTQIGDFLEFENIKTTKRYFLDEKGLIYKNQDLNFENSKLYLDKDLFKDDALVFNDSNIKQITLKNIENKSRVKVKFDNFPYLGIWSKPNDAPFVCIEPWFGVADEKNANQKIEDKKGILSLEKEEEFFCFYTIEV